MLNRLLNSSRNQPVYQGYLELIKQVSPHPLATEDTRIDANGFLEYQAS